MQWILKKDIFDSCNKMFKLRFATILVIQKKYVRGNFWDIWGAIFTN
jgi:hypothetical protein